MVRKKQSLWAERDVSSLMPAVCNIMTTARESGERKHRKQMELGEVHTTALDVATRQRMASVHWFFP